MSVSRFPLNRTAFVTAVFGGKDLTYFWEDRFLPRWLPLLTGVGLGVLLAILITDQAWYFLIPIVVALPAIAFLNRYPFGAVMVWMLLLPYFLNEPTTAGRAIYWILHRAMIPAALGIVIISGSLGLRRRTPPIRIGSAELAMLIFLGLTLASIFLFNPDPVHSVITVYDRFFVPFCMYWLIRLSAPSEKDLKRFLWVAFITLTAQCVIGLLSWFAPEVLPSRWINIDTAGARTTGSLRNGQVYTSTLLLLGLLLYQHAMNCRSKLIHYLILAAFGLAIFCVFFSFSRSSWLGCLMMLAGLAFLYPKRTLSLTIILVLVVFILSSNVLAQEVAFGYERLTGEAAERSANARVIVHNAMFEMAKNKPFFGWGYGQYKLYYGRFMTRVGNIPAKYYGVPSHSTFLTIMTELGVVGLALYLFPVLWWLVLSLKAGRQLPSHGFISWRLLVMLWLLILHMIIVNNSMDMLFFVFGTTVWWMALGLIANLVHPTLNRGEIRALGSSQQVVGH